MNRIHERFGRRRVLLPVVHCVAELQVCNALEVAFANGADGAFLIDQGGMDSAAIANLVWGFSGVPWLGLNILGNTQCAQVIAHEEMLQAVWSDRCDFDPTIPRSYRHALNTPGQLFFGGVAFKYQARVAEVGGAAIAAAGAGIDVVTTSGPATGSPPTVEKIARMRAALGDHALAIASGITPENVSRFLPYANAFLVATGIEERFGHFDPARVKALADAIHEETP